MRGSRLLILAAASIVAALSQRIIAQNISATSADCTSCRPPVTASTAVASWQQFALKWTGAVSVPQTARCEAAGSAQDSTQAPTAVTEPREVSAPERDQPGPSKARAGVCVCVDETGKITDAPVLTNSSGIPGFDKAALELSAATRYRPATATNGKPAAGCFRFKVGIEAK